MSERRSLAPVERMVDVFDRGSTLNFTMIARLSGALSAELLQSALRRLELRHPLLRARVDRSQSATVFVMGEARPIPLSIVDGPVEAWRELAEASLAHRVWDDAGPRAELTWLRHSEQGSTLLLLFHHLVSDGCSGMFAMRDLIQLAANPNLTLAPIPSHSPAAFYPEGHGSWAWKLRAFRMIMGSMLGSKPQRLRVATEGPRRARLARLQIPREESRTLLECARRDGATVHGVLSAAYARAVAAQLGSGPVAERILHPVDLRRYGKSRYPENPHPGEAVGYHVSSLETNHRVDLSRPLGELAREITLAIRQCKEDEKPLLTAPLAGPLLSKRHERTAGELSRFRSYVENKVVFDTFGLSNLGPLENLGVEPDCDALFIEDIYFVAAGSVLSTLSGSVTTFQDSITLTVCWVEPFVSHEVGERFVNRLEQELSTYLDEQRRSLPVEVIEVLRE